MVISFGSDCELGCSGTVAKGATVVSARASSPRHGLLEVHRLLADQRRRASA
jgi:hypothetical protein